MKNDFYKIKFFVSFDLVRFECITYVFRALAPKSN